FNINGISDVKVPANGSNSLALSVQYTSGVQENVTLGITGVPGKTTSEFSTTSGIPTFASTLSFTSNMEAEGIYPLTLTSTSVSGVKKEFNFNLIIDKPSDCSTSLLGTYQGSQQCMGNSPYNSSMIVTAG